MITAIIMLMITPRYFFTLFSNYCITIMKRSYNFKLWFDYNFTHFISETNFFIFINNSYFIFNQIIRTRLTKTCIIYMKKYIFLASIAGQPWPFEPFLATTAKYAYSKPLQTMK